MNLRRSSASSTIPSTPQEIRRKIRKILKKETASDKEEIFLKENAEYVEEIGKRRQKQALVKTRSLEYEDEASIVIKQCHELADALAKSQHAIVYTGAGVSTSANIPDFRGTSGVWTQLRAGKSVKLDQSLTNATPTTAHMCLKAFHDAGIIKHIVSQNCDGLHLRSGIPQESLSEVHGNMYVEVCTECNKQVYRIFDVTRDTSLHRHKTERTCKECGSQLRDTIVHFGERSNLRWPHNWQGAEQNADSADLILCLGSSLKVLRSYKQLWLTERRKDKRPSLYIVNLQWTPKDSQAKLKIHGRVDYVMKKVAEALQLSIPTYRREDDPLYRLAEPCPFDGPLLPIPQEFAEKFTPAVYTEGLRADGLDLKAELNSDADIESEKNSIVKELKEESSSMVAGIKAGPNLMGADNKVGQNSAVSGVKVEPNSTGSDIKADLNSIGTGTKVVVASASQEDLGGCLAMDRTCQNCPLNTDGESGSLQYERECAGREGKGGAEPSVAGGVAAPAWFGKGRRTIRNKRTGRKRKKLAR